MKKETRRERDKEMINDPRKWVTFPFLPVMRKMKGSGVEVGIILSAGDHLTVFDCNLFMLPEKLSDFGDFDRWDYKTIDDLLDDGWTVD